MSDRNAQSSSFFQTVKEQVDLEDYLTKHLNVELVSGGGGMMHALCPFHEEDTPSFIMNDDGERPWKTWHCFGSCQEGGTVLDAVMKGEDSVTDVFEAADFLNELYDLGLEANSDAYKRFKKTVEETRAATEKAREEMSDGKSAVAKQARSYLNNRGYTDETIDNFELGVDKSTTQAGRLAIPIYDKMGQPVSVANRALYDEFACRACGAPVTTKEMVKRRHQAASAKKKGADPPFAPAKPEDCPHCNAPGSDAKVAWLTGQNPKYLFLKDFDKARYLYHEHGARGPLIKDPDGTTIGLFLVEGYPDAWAGWQSGHRAIVAYSGSVLSDEQAKEAIELAKKAGKPIILVPDFDETGQGRLNSGSGVGANIRKLRAVDPTVEVQVIHGIDELMYEKAGEKKGCKDLGEVLQHCGAEKVSEVLTENRWPAGEWQIRQVMDATNPKTGEPFYSKTKEMELIGEIIQGIRTRESLDHLIPNLAQHWNIREEQARNFFYAHISAADQLSAQHLFKDIEQAQHESAEFLADANVIPLGFEELDKCFPGGGVRPGQLMMMLGKAQPLDAKVLTPGGWKRMGDMQVGDAIVNPEGGIAHVRGVFPQGDRPIYKVTFSDGASTECDREHLWKVAAAGFQDWTVQTLAELDDGAVTGTDWSHKRRYIPTPEPVEFSSEPHLPVAPYLLGVCLADPKGVGQFKATRGSNLDRNPLAAQLDELGVFGKRSETRFVPESYLLASAADRLELLRGLMDIGGGQDESTSGTCEFSSASRELSDAVQYIARSLGGTATMETDPASDVAETGTRPECPPRYRVSVSLPPGANPFKLARKASQWTRTSTPRRSIADVQPAGIKPAQCIALDSDNQLYITDDFVVTHNSGTGKAQPLHAKVLTPGGWKLMGDMQVGDAVADPTGGVARVRGVFPQGQRDIYRVTFSDGSSTECDRDHLWKVLDSNRKWQVRELGRLLDRIDFANSPHYIPLTAPVDFEPRGDLPLDPYLLGVLLGDAGFTNSNPILSSADPEIVEWVAEVLPDGVVPRKIQGDNVDWDLTRKRGLGPNPLTVALKDMGLWGRYAHQKHVPDQYLWGTADNRLSLLRGLMDTDGSVFTTGASSTRSVSAEYCTASRQLADAVLFLVRSLGGTACIASGPSALVDSDGLHHPGRTCRRVRVSLPLGMNPFRLARKADRYRRRVAPSRRIMTAEFVGRKPAQCISLDSDSQLYITDDFVVTHNTMLASQMLANMADADVNCLFFSLEQGAGSFFPRLACQALDRPVPEVEELIKEDHGDLSVVRELYRNMLLVDNVPTETQEAVAMTPGKVQSIISEANLTYFEGKPVDVVIIDHLGILEVGSEASADVRSSETAAPGWIMKELFKVAKATRTFIIVLQQLPKQVPAGVPFAMDAGWGGSGQTNFSDYVIQIWRPEQEQGISDEDRLQVEGQYKIALGKNRFGAGALCNYFFDKTTLRILPPLSINQPKVLDDGSDQEIMFEAPDFIPGEDAAESAAASSSEVGATEAGLRALVDATPDSVPRDTQALLDAIGAVEESPEPDPHADDPFADADVGNVFDID